MDVFPAATAAALQRWVVFIHTVISLISYLWAIIVLHKFSYSHIKCYCLSFDSFELFYLLKGKLIGYVSLFVVVFRSVFPALLPGEQLVSRHAGCFLPGSVPVFSVALLALRLPWHQGSGWSWIDPVILHLPFKLSLFSIHVVCVDSTGWKEMLDLLPAQVDHRRSAVALSCHIGYLANVRKISAVQRLVF